MNIYSRTLNRHYVLREEALRAKYEIKMARFSPVYLKYFIRKGIEIIQKNLNNLKDWQKMEDLKYPWLKCITKFVFKKIERLTLLSFLVE